MGVQPIPLIHCLRWRCQVNSEPRKGGEKEKQRGEEAGGEGRGTQERKGEEEEGISAIQQSVRDVQRMGQEVTSGVEVAEGFNVGCTVFNLIVV